MHEYVGYDPVYFWWQVERNRARKRSANAMGQARKLVFFLLVSRDCNITMALGAALPPLLHATLHTMNQYFVTSSIITRGHGDIVGSRLGAV